VSRTSVRTCHVAVPCRLAKNTAVQAVRKRDRKKSKLHVSVTTEPARLPPRDSIENRFRTSEECAITQAAEILSSLPPSAIASTR
jgi:guanylate kinase